LIEHHEKLTKRGGELEALLRQQEAQIRQVGEKIQQARERSESLCLAPEKPTKGEEDRRAG
jgi:hypothetical protein